jgi:hypothetical protein
MNDKKQDSNRCDYLGHFNYRIFFLVEYNVFSNVNK